MLKILSLGVVFLVSCSQINPQEQEVYQAKQFRHGIIPLSTPKTTKVEVIKNKIVVQLDSASVTRGRAIYEKHCVTCHGVTGEGNGSAPLPNGSPKPANLKKTVAEVENFDFYLSVSNWKGTMPGWKNPLTESEKADLINYIKTFRN